MTNTPITNGVSRILQRIAVEYGAPDSMVVQYAISEGLHSLAGHELENAQDCDTCNNTAVNAITTAKHASQSRGKPEPPVGSVVRDYAGNLWVLRRGWARPRWFLHLFPRARLGGRTWSDLTARRGPLTRLKNSDV